MINLFKMNKDKIIRIIVIVGILLCILGIMNKIFEFTIFNFFKNMTKPYLERAYEESKKLFITLSLLKGTTDVIEGPLRRHDGGHDRLPEIGRAHV